MFTIETLLGELSVSVVLAPTTVLQKFLEWFSKGFSPSEHEDLKLGLFFIRVMFFSKSIKNVNDGYITDSRFLYFVASTVHLSCRDVGRFETIGFIKVGESKFLNSDLY